MDQDQNHYFIVIFGPPATGKSTLARHILDVYQQENPASSVFLLSTDSCEEYLKTHSVIQLKNLLDTALGWSQLAEYKVKRAFFNENLWKKSRQFVRQCVNQWTKKRDLVIIQDDLLLKSQRKQFRQAVQGQKINYIEVYPKATFGECQLNLIRRNKELTKEQQLGIETLQECFQKFEKDPNGYAIEVSKQNKLQWSFLKERAKPVVIEHPEMKVKQEVSEDNSKKDQVEHEIRAYISEIMSSSLLRASYFKDKPVKQVAMLLGKIKKTYSSKHKSLQGFQAFLEKETSQMI